MRIIGRKESESAYLCHHEVALRFADAAGDGLFRWCVGCGALIIKGEATLEKARKSLDSLQGRRMIGATLESDGSIALIPERDGSIEADPDDNGNETTEGN